MTTRKPKPKPIPAALAREALASARLDGETQVIEVKPLPTYHQVLAAIDAHLAREAADEETYYRAGGQSTQRLARREGMEELRHIIRQLEYTEANP